MRIIDGDELEKRFVPKQAYFTESIIEKIKTMPEAERKTGRWINAYPDIEPNPMFMYGICSECGFEQSISDRLNFCPNCGADMRGEQNEDNRDDNHNHNHDNH